MFGMLNMFRKILIFTLFLSFPGCKSSLTPVEYTLPVLQLADGTRFFPIGLSRFPERRTDEKMYEEVINTGFNFVVNHPGHPGLRRACNLPRRILSDGVTRLSAMDLSIEPDSATAVLKRFIALNEKKSDIAVWNGPDEPNYFPFGEQRYPSAGGLIKGYQYIRAKSHHPIWINLGPTGTFNDPADMDSNRPFLPAADVWSSDIYPVPLSQNYQKSPFVDMGLAQVGKFVRVLRQQLIEDGQKKKPVWMWLQGFGWEDLGKQGWEGKQPTREEIRFMTYDAIINGATGIIYWGVFAIEANSEYWTILKSMAGELQQLMPALLGEASFITSTNPEVETAARIGKNMLYVLAANTSSTPVSGVDIQLPKKVSKSAAVLFEDRTCPIHNGKLKDNFQPYEVHVYRLGDTKN